MSLLSRSRIRQPVIIPDVLKNGKYRLTGIRRFQPYSLQVAMKTYEQFPRTAEQDLSAHFIEIQPKLVADYVYIDPKDSELIKLNQQFGN